MASIQEDVGLSTIMRPIEVAKNEDNITKTEHLDV